MAAARKRLTDTSEKLRVAVSDLNAVDGDIKALTTGVGGLSLSEAASKVKEAAEKATVEALKVLKAAKAAETAATNASAAVGAAEVAKEAAIAAAKAAKETAAAAAKAAEDAKAAATAAAAWEVAIKPPAPVGHMYVRILSRYWLDRCGYCSSVSRLVA